MQSTNRLQEGRVNQSSWVGLCAVSIAALSSCATSTEVTKPSASTIVMNAYPTSVYAGRSEGVSRWHATQKAGPRGVSRWQPAGDVSRGVPSGAAKVARNALQADLSGAAVVQGRVVDAKSYLPIRDGWVAVGLSGSHLRRNVNDFLYGRIGRQEFERTLVSFTKTNEHGEFDIANPRGGSLAAVAFANNYSLQFFSVSAPQLAELEVELRKRPLLNF